MRTIEELEAELAALKAQLATAQEWSEEDEPLPEDAQIHAAHPQNKDAATPADWLRWEEALRLVSKKRSKYSLVDLVNWIMTDRDKAQANAAYFLSCEHAVSAGYVRLRVKLQALDIPPGATPEQIRAHTEAKLDDLIRQRAELLSALEALSNCYCGSLEGVGGGTRIAPSMTVQLFKNARTAIANVKGTKP